MENIKAKCCGLICETPYCPLCGKQVISADTAVMRILNRTRLRVLHSRKDVKRGERWVSEFGLDTEGKRQDYLERAQYKLKKNEEEYNWLISAIEAMNNLKLDETAE